MLFLDRPYISAFLLKTIEENHIPVVRTGYAEVAVKGRDIALLDEAEAVALANNNSGLRLLTISENSIGWIAENLGFLDAPKKINAFKDKLKFRKLTAQ